MASQPTNYQQNVHQVELTVAWSLIVNVSVVCAVFKHDKLAALAHLMFGCIILLLCYTFIIYFCSLMASMLILWAGGFMLTGDWDER